MKKNGEILHCKSCGDGFYVNKARLKTAKFCSPNCQKKLQYLGKRNYFKCIRCGRDCEAPASTRKSRKKYCSRECFDITSKDRYDNRMRAAVLRRLRGNTRLAPNTLKKYIFFQRDHKCELCGFSEHKSALEIHHIDENARNNEPSNVKILCANCHRRTHFGDYKTEVKPIPKDK